ncbi:rnd efflux pump membrane fusion protein barrel-sandwich domain [Lucifera butyrica]|uniref:Rnd efflux pump membrane fusion protein barrel-sandwich domain n=1 Tax=Lucifera butyrica TaxID=1351585 RepID=A0A498R8U2_9FIRM|nr:efflux RND transporter periplasmic adaptor subunit [Lucifera butyrica]VBB07801.1 rnd efflux pump membrane fusion protein barrel-sandwich domain [Lucifera butyrica]
MKKQAAFLGIAVIAVFLLTTGCGSKVKPGTAAINRPVVTGVTVAAAKRTALDDFYETSGTVKAKTVSAVASKVMGNITAILVKEGDRVRKGQVLLTIDDRDVAPKVRSAQAGYEEALQSMAVAGQNQSLMTTTYERYKQLYDDKVVSQQEMDQVENQKKVADLELERQRQSVTQARAGVAEAQAYYDFTRVVAPIAGVVAAKKADVGSMAVTGVPLLIIDDNTTYTVEADLAESLADKINTGMTVNVFIDSLERQVTGKVTEVAPAIDPAARKFHVKIEIPGGGLKSGLYARIRIPVGRREGILVPAGAIVTKGQLTGVYTVDSQGVISYRIVKTGKEYGKQIEIVAGIQPGDKVVVEGADKAVDGGIVKEVNSQ